jgi:SAM-dependent methyltransferase
LSIKQANREFSERWRDERRVFETIPSRRNAATLIVPWVASHLSPGDRVADIAGGVGTYASLIARTLPVQVVGLDISETMIEARAEDPLLTENIVGDMEDLPFADGSFDACLFVACLHHVPDPLVTLEEAFRVLRAGGQLFVFEPASLRARGGNRPIAGAPQEFRLSRSWLLACLRAAGFMTQEAQGFRVGMRFLRLVSDSTAPRTWAWNERLDRLLAPLPLVNRLGEIVRIRALKAGPGRRRGPTPALMPG